jgi:hypothetical protein
MSFDLINALFECSGGAFVALNAWDIYRKKRVAGQTLTAIGFFTAWGAWNMIYYPAIGQWWSTAGAWGVMLANATLVGLVLKYRDR